MRRRGGFTLVEVLVAVVVSGLCVLAGAGIFGAVTDTARHLRSSIDTWEARANARMWMQEFALTLRVDADDPFIGLASELLASGHVWSSRGWMTPRRVTIAVVDGALVARQDDASNGLILRESVERLGIEYLPQGGSSEWRTEWRSETTLPALIRMRLSQAGEATFRADTILMIVGGGA